MAQVFIEETTLSSIGDAIRNKGGTSELISPLDMPNAIINLPSGGGGIEIEPIVLSGSMEYACSGAMASKYIELFGNTISTKDVTNLNYAFKSYKNDTIPFDINCNTSSTLSMGYVFEDTRIKELPRILNCKPNTMSWTFYGSKYLKEIPDGFCDTWDWSYLQNN